MENNVIEFSQLKRKEVKEVKNDDQQLKEIGYIKLNLFISEDGKNINLRPSIELNNYVDEETFKKYCNLIIEKLPKTLNKLVEFYNHNE